METTVFKIKCRNCDKDIYFSAYQNDSKECQKGRCWLKTLKARTEVAVLKGCNAEDLVAPSSGKITLYKEDKLPERFNSSTGRWVKGVWVPWGMNVDTYDCY